MTDTTRYPNAHLRPSLTLPDEKLVAECEVDMYRATGPGGQHRNKVSTAIRLRHKASGLVATGTERRSQAQNKTHAIKRLREALALVARAPLPVDLVWPESVQIHQRRLKVNEKNPALPEVLALALDAVYAAEGKIADAARALDVTTSSLTKFLAEHQPAWRAANEIRAAAGLKPLQPR